MFSRKKLIGICSVLLYFIFVIGVYIKYYPTQGFKTELKIDVAQEISDIPVGEITKGLKVGQTFKSKHSGLTAVLIKLATYNRENTGSVIIRLKESPSSTKEIYSTTIDISQIKDNEFFEFKFSPIKTSKDKNYYVEVEGLSSTIGNAITAWRSNTDTYTEGQFYLNGEVNNSDISFKTIYTEYKNK